MDNETFGRRNPVKSKIYTQNLCRKTQQNHNNKIMIKTKPTKNGRVFAAYIAKMPKGYRSFGIKFDYIQNISFDMSIRIVWFDIRVGLFNEHNITNPT